MGGEANHALKVDGNRVEDNEPIKACLQTTAYAHDQEPEVISTATVQKESSSRGLEEVHHDKSV